MEQETFDSLTPAELQANLDAFPLDGIPIGEQWVQPGFQSPAYSPASPTPTPPNEFVIRETLVTSSQFPGDLPKFIINNPAKVTPAMLQNLTPSQMVKIRAEMSIREFTKLQFPIYPPKFMEEVQRLQNAKAHPKPMTKADAADRNVRTKNVSANDRGQQLEYKNGQKKNGNVLVPKYGFPEFSQKDQDQYKADMAKNTKTFPGAPPSEIIDQYMSRILKPLPYLDRLIRMSIYARLSLKMNQILVCYDDIMLFKQKGMTKRTMLVEMFQDIGLITNDPSDLLSALTFYWLIEEPIKFLESTYLESYDTRRAKTYSVTGRRNLDLLDDEDSYVNQKRVVAQTTVSPKVQKEIPSPPALSSSLQEKIVVVEPNTTPIVQYVPLVSVDKPINVPVPHTVHVPSTEPTRRLEPISAPVPATVLSPMPQTVREEKLNANHSPLRDIVVTAEPNSNNNVLHTTPCKCVSIDELARKACGYHPNKNEPTIEKLRMAVYGCPPPGSIPPDPDAPLPGGADPFDVIFEKPNSAFIRNYNWIERFYTWFPIEKRMVLSHLAAGPNRDGRPDAQLNSTMYHTDPKMAVYRYEERYLFRFFRLRIPIIPWFWFDCGQVLVSREIACQVMNANFFSTEDDPDTAIERIRKFTSISGNINYDRTVSLDCHDIKRDTAFFCRNMWHIISHLKRDQPFLGDVVQQQGLKGGSVFSVIELMRSSYHLFRSWTQPFVSFIAGLSLTKYALSCVYHSVVISLTLPTVILTRLMVPVRFLASHIASHVRSGLPLIQLPWLDMADSSIASLLSISILCPAIVMSLLVHGLRELNTHANGRNNYTIHMWKTFLPILIFFYIALGPKVAAPLLKTSLIALLSILAL